MQVTTGYCFYFNIIYCFIIFFLLYLFIEMTSRSLSILIVIYHYMHDATLLLQEEIRMCIYTHSGVEPSWKPDDAIVQQHGKMMIA